MELLPEQTILAIGALVEISKRNGSRQPLPAPVLAARLKIRPRGLEFVLQALVRHDVLRATRGPRGGYLLAHPASDIPVSRIISICADLSKRTPFDSMGSSVLDRAVLPTINSATAKFLHSLDSTTIADLCAVDGRAAINQAAE